MTKCIFCGKEIPLVRKKKYKKTCSSECGFNVFKATASYMMNHKDKFLRDAVREFKKRENASQIQIHR